MNVSDIINSVYRGYALYTIEHRAIPNLMDGLKPVQRLLVYAMNRAGQGKHKNSDIAGRLAGYGYAHGETSAQDALALLAADWNNQVPVFNQHGTFGSRYNQKAAAARYIYVSKRDDLKSHFSEDNAVPSPDPDIDAPLYYLPQVPWVLLNGIQGIAVGFATLILPRELKSIKDAIVRILDGKPVGSIPVASFTGRGECWQDSDNPKKFYFEGLLASEKTYRGRTTVNVIDLPYRVTRSVYFKSLETLVESGKIENFQESSGKDGFCFNITMDKEQSVEYKKDPIGYLKLRKSYVENITVVDHEGNLKVFESPIDLINYWVQVRLEFYGVEKSRDLARMSVEFQELTAVEHFLVSVVTGKMEPWTYKSRKLLEMELKSIYTNVHDETIQKLASMSAYKFTVEEIDKVVSKSKELVVSIAALKKKSPQTIMKENLK